MPKSTAELFAKEIQKELNKSFIELCKSKTKGLILADIDSLVAQGAQITASGCKAMYLAVKNHNFELIDYLVSKGILVNPLARGYLAAMCDFGDFAKVEDKFFARIDKAVECTGFSIDYIVPYVNTAFLHGEHDKALALSDKYPVSRTEIVDTLYPRIIFEMIDKDLVDGLAIVNGYRDWMDEKSLGIAISSGNVKVIRYILAKKKIAAPVSSVCDAVFQGYRDALDAIELKPNPALIKKAQSSKDAGMVEYLKGRGVIR